MNGGDELLTDRSEPAPPSPSLLAAIAAMKPVRTRVPWRAPAALGALLLGAASVVCAVRGLRADLPYLPIVWVWAAGAAWLVGFAVPLATALLPPRGQVLPDPGRAARSAALVAAVLMAICLGARAAPGHSLPSDGAALLPRLAHCLRFSLTVGVGATLLMLWAVRRLVRVGGWRIGAALGAAGGALSGLMLHVICPYASPLHVAGSHGAGVALGALLGALLARAVLAR